MSNKDFEDFEEALSNINKKLDEIELEIDMSTEAIESIGISLMLLETELNFEKERNENDHWA